MNKTWKIGTRGSLLALTQCQQTRELLESRSGEKFELVVIKTQGDQQTDKPLWQLEGKDFFTKELDEALLKNEVDLVVHSYKDLGSERPHGIELAAVVERKYGHDILLIPKKNIEALKAGTIKELIVGTSSPRRITNLENQLSSSCHQIQKFRQRCFEETLIHVYKNFRTVIITPSFWPCQD